MSYALNYQASPTVARFLKSRETRKILAGPVGAGKTSACTMHILLNAMHQEPDSDGIRRTRHLVVRNTVPMLKTTTIKSFLDWIPSGVFGTWLTSDKTYYMRFADVEAEVLFMSLEDANDIRKLLSLETTTVFFNEFKEINPDVVEAMIGTKRVGRYPSRARGPGATYPCFLADTNMPAFDSWHQRVMDGEVGDWKLFKQPGGRSPDAENLKFLPPNYYDTAGMNEEYIRTMIDCEYGTSQEGLPVFRHTFNAGFHVAPEHLKPIYSSAHPLIIGVDAGLLPAALICQQTPSGAVVALAECYTPKDTPMGMERFLDTKLLPLLRNRFPNNPAVVIVDPAAKQRSQANEETPFDIIMKKRLMVFPAGTNKIELRIGAMERLLSRQVGGKAGFLIDPDCLFFIQALKHAYKFAAKKDGELQEKPLKNAWSHLMDGAMYAAVYIAGETAYAEGAPVRKVLPAPVRIV